MSSTSSGTVPLPMLPWLARQASMWVSWVVARWLVVGLLLAALAFVALEVTLFLLTAPFLD